MADSPYTKAGLSAKGSNLFYVDLKSRSRASQGRFLGDVPDLSHSGEEHRIWNRTDLGSSPHSLTSWFRS